MIRVEWIRQVRRARTWACLAALAAVPILFTVASYVDPPRQRRELNIFTLLTASGLIMAWMRWRLSPNLALVAASRMERDCKPSRLATTCKLFLTR